MQFFWDKEDLLYVSCYKDFELFYMCLVDIYDNSIDFYWDVWSDI